MVSALRDLKVFCNKTELHLLCMLLDRYYTGLIDYGFVETGLSYIRCLFCSVSDCLSLLRSDFTVSLRPRLQLRFHFDFRLDRRSTPIRLQFGRATTVLRYGLPVLGCCTAA